MAVQVQRELVIKARYDKGYSVQQVAAKAGISRQTVYDIESGRSKGNNADTVRRLCQVLELQPSAVIQL